MRMVPTSYGPPVVWGRQPEQSTEVQLYGGEVWTCLGEEIRSDLKEDTSDLSPLEVTAKDTRECMREHQTFWHITSMAVPAMDNVNMASKWPHSTLPRNGRVP
jgi:hypothetical protein